MRIEDALAAFLTAKAKLSAGTLAWYELQVKAFIAWLSRQKINGSTWLRPETVEKFLAEEQERISEASVAGEYRALLAFFNWLVERKYLAVSPMVGVERRVPPKHIPRRTDLHEYEALLDSIPQAHWLDLRDRLAINVMFLCGLRVSEVSALRLPDFDVPGKLLTVRAGKGNKDRFVPMQPAVIQAFVQYIYGRPAWSSPDVMLAADVSGNVRGVIKPNGLRIMLRRRCKAANVRYLNPHSFRHGLAMYLLNHGGDMSLVQKILGHSKISTTAEYYAEWVTDGMVRDFTEKMGRAGNKKNRAQDS